MFFSSSSLNRYFVVSFVFSFFSLIVNNPLGDGKGRWLSEGGGFVLSRRWVGVI